MTDNGTEQTQHMVDLPAESVPVVAEAEVVVVGGGTSGFIAATAAARTGAKTLIVERFGYLGGCSTAPYNTSIGLFGDSDGNLIIKGLGYEFIRRMEADGQAFWTPPGRNQIWPVWTKKVALDMVEEAGVDLLFYTWVTGVVREGGTIKGLVVQNKGGRGVILAKTVVDASGDADIAAYMGAPYEMADPDEIQQVSCDYIACGVDSARVYEWASANQDKLEKVSGLNEESKQFGTQSMLTFVIPQQDTAEGGNYHVGVMPTVKLCIYREAVRLQGNSDIDPLDPVSLTKAETEGLRGVVRHLDYLKENVPGFEGAFIVGHSHLGVRETRQVIGDYQLKIDDLRNQARFDDVVALSCRALDYHLKGTVFKIEFLKGNYDIPLRALLPKGVDNLLIAGRSISCDHLAQASLRGAATCLATGHAAGTTAALAAQNSGKTREVDVEQLQQTLLEQDVVLGTGERGELFSLKA